MGVARISTGGGGGHRSSAKGQRENRGVEGAKGGGVSGRVWGRRPLPRQFVFNFYIKIVSCRAFWVAISYRLAAGFTPSLRP